MRKLILLVPFSLITSYITITSLLTINNLTPFEDIIISSVSEKNETIWNKEYIGFSKGYKLMKTYQMSKKV